MYIDIDSHIFPKEALPAAESAGYREYVDERGREYMVTPRKSLRNWGKRYYDLEERRAAFRDAGFDRQVLICDQGFAPDYVPLETSIKIFQGYNDAVSRIQKGNEDFIGCAEVPHQDPNAAINEARRAINDLGLKAIRVYGSWSGKNIESEDWLPFFELVNELRVPLLFHPHGIAGLGDVNPNILGRDRLQNLGYVRAPSGEMKPVWLHGGIPGFVLEAFVFISGLVLHGILKKYRNINVCILESGASWVPFLASRLDYLKETMNAMRNENPNFYGTWCPITTDPSEYVKRHFWFTLDHVGEVTIPFLIRELGMGSRLVVQTDFPHPEGSLDVLRWVKQMDISDSDKERILGKNAAEILKIV
ncbi:MAG: amidohydrolase family protein [Nitrososphaerota archaeon]|nr:amidohydrolase family protein [Nitrososphaerota archaeon]